MSAVQEELAWPMTVWPGIPAAEVSDRVERDDHVLIWQVHGTSQVTVDGLPCLLHARQALLIPAGVRHGMVQHADSIALPLLVHRTEHRVVVSEPRLVDLPEEMRILVQVAVQRSATLIRPEVDAAGILLRWIVSGGVDHTDLPIPSSPAARRVALAIRLNPGDRRGLAAWAELAHVSLRTLQRAFVEETGMTLRSWRTACRIREARAQLAGGLASSIVARRVGFSDASAFARAFRAETGLSPGDHARAASAAGRTARGA